MLATLGVVVAEATTGVAWQDAGKVELDGAQYLGFSLPFTVTCALPPSRCAASPFATAMFLVPATVQMQLRDKISLHDRFA